MQPQYAYHALQGEAECLMEAPQCEHSKFMRPNNNKQEKSEVCTMAEPWDVLLCRGQGLVHEAILLAQNHNLQRQTQWSHVGLIITSEVFPHPKLKPGELYVLESTAGGLLGDGVYDVVREETFVGVQIRPLQELLALEGDQYAWLPLLERPALRDRSDVVYRYLHKGYDWSPLCLVSSVLERTRPLRNLFINADSRFFCSELVARVYQDLGLLSDELRADNVIPADFVGGGELPQLWGEPVPMG